MHVRGIFIILIAILISTSIAFALTYTSSNYTLTTARVVPSAGQATSLNYSLSEVTVASPFGGQAHSPNYSLDTSNLKPRTPPHPPTLEPVTTPTNQPFQTLTGTKDPETSIYINGYEAVPQDNQTTWSYDYSLAEGENNLIIIARNQYQLESAAIYAFIILDTIPPATPTLNPVSSPTNISTQTISGSKEAHSSIWINNLQRVPQDPFTTWSAELSLAEGENLFTITAKDVVLNESGAVVINVFLDTTPPTTPEVVDDGVYTTSTTQLHVSWSATDPQTNIIEYQYAIGTEASGSDIVAWTALGTATEVTHTELALTQGQTYYISVKAQNAAGSWSEVGSSDGIFVNQTIPAIIEIQPPDASSGYTEENINFSVNAQDEDGDDLLFQFSLGGEIIQPWQGSPDFSWATAGVSLGLHTITVEVSDNHGGVISQEIELCLFRRPPMP